LVPFCCCVSEERAPVVRAVRFDQVERRLPHRHQDSAHKLR
jgi:hypothetical protein